MSKSNILSQKEFSNYRIPGQFLNVLEGFARTHGLSKNEVNVLDWGCGRGRFVLSLRETGYNAFGVDIDPAVINNGTGIFYELSKATTNLGIFPLQVISKTNLSPFPDGYFHLIFSGQVLEHIERIDLVAKEMARITINEGLGYHNYPADMCLVEPHLFMPLVHWLPKNRLRKALIKAFVMLGKHPGWSELACATNAEKLDAYYQYSINKTFYRSTKLMREAFENQGFKVEFDAFRNPKLLTSGGVFAKPQFRIAVNYLINRFVISDMFLAKS